MFRVEEVPGKGRGAVASAAIAAGAVVLECDPWLVLLHEPAFTCRWCFASRSPLDAPYRLRCERCGVRYCSDRCRELGRRVHEEEGECEAVAGVAKEMAADRDDDECDEVLAVVMAETARQQGRAAVFDERLCSEPQLDAARVARVARHSGRVLGREVGSERAVAVVGKVASNSFGLDAPLPPGEFSEDGEPDVCFLGRAVYLEASFFNHTCEPPALVRVRSGRRLRFVARRQIAAGEELCITYINSARHSEKGERQALLHELYGFHCGCGVCEGRVAPLARLCERCGCCEFLGERDQWCCVCDTEKIEETLL